MNTAPDLIHPMSSLVNSKTLPWEIEIIFYFNHGRIEIHLGITEMQCLMDSLLQAINYIKNQDIWFDVYH